MESENKKISQVITFESDLVKPKLDEYKFITKTESETEDMLKDMVTKFENNEIAEPKISTGNLRYNFNGKVFESSASYNANEHYLAMKSDLPGYTYDIKIYQDNLTLYELMNEESGKYYDVHQFPSLSILNEYYRLIASKYVLQGLIDLTLTDLERTISDFKNNDIFLLEASSEKTGHLHIGYKVLSTNDLHFFEIEDYIIVDTVSIHYEDGEYVVYNSFSNVKECEISKSDLSEYKDISLTKEKAFDLATSISNNIDNNNYVEPRKITVDSLITTNDPSNDSIETKMLLAYDFDKHYFRIGGRSPFGEYKEAYIFEENYVLFELVEDINGVKTRTLHPCKDEVELESTYNVLLRKYAAFSMGEITKMFALNPFLEFKDKENALIHAYSKNEGNLVVSAYDEATDTGLDFEIIDSLIAYTRSKVMIQNGTIEAHYTVECDVIIPNVKDYSLV